MVKLISIAFAIFIISYQQQACIAFVITTVDTVLTVMSIGTYLHDMYSSTVEEVATSLDPLVEIRKMNEEIEYGFESISTTLTQLPSIINLLEDRRSLRQHYHQIRMIFEEAVEYHNRIKHGDVEDHSIYEYFRNDKDAALDEHITIIYFILLNNESVSYLVRNFTKSLERYENVCITGMSYMQLLDSLLVKLRIATAQYFTAKNLMLDLLELGGPRKYNSTRKLFMRSLESRYRTSAIQFKQMMTRASREVYRCDKRVYIDDERYKQPNDSSYYEIQSFQKYIINVDTAIERGHNCIECAAINHAQINHCGYNTRFCPKTRICRSNLLDCESLLQEPTITSWRTPLTQVCLNERNAYARYERVIQNESSQYNCNGHTTRIQHYIRNQFTPYTSRHCKWCQCICQENDYYISLLPEVSNVAANKIVTGARLIIEDKTLYIQIEEGKVLANGTIDKNTMSWKPVGKGTRTMISWEEVREIDLTETILPIDRVLAGLVFQKNGKRISLGVFSNKYDFRTAKLTGELRSLYKLDVPAPAKEELDLRDRDVTTKTKMPNMPDSTTNQFVKFTTTKLELDGGQTTIPFIDTQVVKPNPVIPLAGAGLFHTGQKGYGGFISLKLYTYNIVPFIVVDSEI